MKNVLWVIGLTALLVLASCAGSLSATADALDAARDTVTLMEQRLEQARLDGNESAIVQLEGALEEAQAEVGRIASVAREQIAKGGPEDAQWAGTIGGVVSDYGGPFGSIGLLFGAYAQWRRKQWEQTATRVVKSIGDTGLIDKADADTRKRIEVIQGPKVTAKVKEVTAKQAEARA